MTYTGRADCCEAVSAAPVTRECLSARWPVLWLAGPSARTREDRQWTLQRWLLWRVTR